MGMHWWTASRIRGVSRACARRPLATTLAANFEAEQRRRRRQRRGIDMLAWGHLARAREAPRVRLAVNQCIPTGALLAGSFGKEMI